MTLVKEEPMLFPWIAKTKAEFLKERGLKKEDLINLGIGDVSYPLSKVVTEAIKDAADEMSTHVIGYGDECGLDELKEKVAATVYQDKICKDEVFITEGIANSLSHLMTLFKEGSTIGVLSPTYPVYKSLLKTHRMNIYEVESDDAFEFHPPDNAHLDAMIICSPNNPTGKAFAKESLSSWVRWANERGVTLLFDAAYECFIDDESPSSIYEIEGAKNCAIECVSFSKSMGFTGLRLGFFVFPKKLMTKGGLGLDFCKDLICSKTNGVSYVIQKAGLAALSPEGLKEREDKAAHYLKMTKTLKSYLQNAGETVVGGDHAPYLFWKVGGSSKEKFKSLLHEKCIVTVPGIGFGMEGYLRLSGFITDETLERVKKALCQG